MTDDIDTVGAGGASRFDRYFRRYPERFPVLVGILGWGLGVCCYGAVVAVTVVYGEIDPTWYVVTSVALAGLLPGYLGYRRATILQATVL